MALRPVWSGSVTGWRKMTPGALRSSGMSTLSPAIGPRPSSGTPSGSTTRPTICSLTPMEAMRPVRRTVMPSLIRSVGPIRTAPTFSGSRFITTAITPFSNSSSSPASAFVSP